MLYPDFCPYLVDSRTTVELAGFGFTLWCTIRSGALRDLVKLLARLFARKRNTKWWHFTVPGQRSKFGIRVAWIPGQYHVAE